MKERIRTSILVILATVALITTISCLYSAEYVGGLACAVVLASVVFDLFDTQRKQTKPTPEPTPVVDYPAIQLRPYKMPKKVIEYYDEAYPYLVVAEKPNSTEVEYWWAGDKDVKDLQHSCIADKYVQLCYFVKSNAVREAHG